MAVPKSINIAAALVKEMSWCLKRKTTMAVIIIAYLDDLSSLYRIIELHLEVLWIKGVIEVELHSRSVPVLEAEWFRRSSNLILTLRMARERTFSIVGNVFCVFQYSSLPSTSILHHMNNVGLPKHNQLTSPFVLGERSSLILLSNFLSKAPINVVTEFDCGNLSCFPMNSGYPSNHWSTEPIKQSSSSTH